MRVLLVDDEDRLRRTLARTLKHIGVEEVSDADSGEAALQLLPGVRPELIITDCNMPGMDGIRFTRALRAAGIEIPIIMLSGATDRAVIESAKRAGVTRFIAKPIELADLRDALKQTAGWTARAA